MVFIISKFQKKIDTSFLCRHLFLGDNWHWVADEDKSHAFLGHARVASFVQSESSNKCVDVDDDY